MCLYDPAHDRSVERRARAGSTSGDYVTYVLQDREGDVWVSTNTGIDQFRASDLAPIDLGPDAAGFSLTPGDDGHVFIAEGVRVTACG